MDWDVDMDDAGPEALPEAAHEDVIDAGRSGQSDSADQEIVPNKVHIKGLDTLTTADVKAYVADHYGAVERVEWIDDTSANLVFPSESAAQEVLVALSVMAIADITQLPVLECLPAKPLSSKPEVNLQVRFAVVADKKQAGAAARSRFYLLHPEYDPEERRRRDQTNRSRYRDRDGGGDGYRSRRGGRGRREDWEDGDTEPFDASLYDDDEATVAERAARARRRLRYTPPEDSDTDTAQSHARRNRDKELFPDHRTTRGNGAVRGRSASPLRGSEEDESMRDSSRVASTNNRMNALSIKANLRHESSNSAKELFPSRVETSGKAQIDRMDAAGEATRLMDRTLGFPLEDADRAGSGDSGTAAGESSAFNIRGLARQRASDGGFTIKGAAGVSARELFPNKFGGNAGKELFAEKLEGRGQRRQRAEDFH